jgi:peptidoglycan L-alanyl-D-glutamate endopeptidase CwlK
MASRQINDLEPETRAIGYRLQAALNAAGLDVVMYCTLRTIDEQARLFRQGRSIEMIREKILELQDLGRDDLARVIEDVGPQYGKRIVTYAGPGQSLHNYGMAIDSVVLIAGKPAWNPNDGTNDEAEMHAWRRYGEIAEDCGFEWAGRWKRFRELPHIQKRGADWRSLITETPFDRFRRDNR